VLNPEGQERRGLNILLHRPRMLVQAAQYIPGPPAPCAQSINMKPATADFKTHSFNSFTKSLLEVGAASGALGNWQLQNYLHAKWSRQKSIAVLRGKGLSQSMTNDSPILFSV
jgi:hypothetical protein